MTRVHDYVEPLRLKDDPVRDAWHAAHCPPDFNPREHVPFRSYLSWLVRVTVRLTWLRFPAALREHVGRALCGMRGRHRFVRALPSAADQSVAWCQHCRAERRAA